MLELVDVDVLEVVGELVDVLVVEEVEVLLVVLELVLVEEVVLLDVLELVDVEVVVLAKVASEMQLIGPGVSQKGSVEVEVDEVVDVVVAWAMVARASTSSRVRMGAFYADPNRAARASMAPSNIKRGTSPSCRSG